MSEWLQGADGNDAAPATLRTYAELNRYTLSEGLTGPYRLWLIARALDPKGSGVISRASFLYTLERLGLSQRQFQRMATHPQIAVFLHITQHKIEYRSLQVVCTALQVIPGRSVTITTASVASLETFRAYLYAAWIAGQKRLLISRARLTALFNVSADTLRRWERTAGVVVTPNVVEVAPNDYEAATPHIPTDARRMYQLDDYCFYTWEYEGQLYYRTVNRYDAPTFQRGRTGNTRKIAKALHPLPADDHGGGTKARVFFGKRDLPAGYQEKQGASLRSSGRQVDLPQGHSALWRFRASRPVSRKVALV